MKKYAIGIDLGGTTVKLGLFKTDGGLLEKWEIKTRTENSGKNILPDIAAEINAVLEKRGISLQDVQGISIGVPGAVLRDSYIAPCVNLNGWGGFDVAKKLSDLCGLPVKVINDANAAALGEMWQGGAKGRKNVVFITLGTGVGGGVVVGGKILSGAHGAGGEIGHITVQNDEVEVCGCGKRGCLEQYASATGIVRMAKQRLNNEKHATKLAGKSDFTCEDVFNCAKEGDAFCISLVDGLANDLGRTLAGISCVCDPEAIVIGGGVSKAGQPLIQSIKEKFVCYAFPTAEQTEICLATLGNDAGIYGCVRNILG